MKRSLFAHVSPIVIAGAVVVIGAGIAVAKFYPKAEVTPAKVAVVASTATPSSTPTPTATSSPTPTATPTATPTPDPRAGWSTYTDKTLGYSFKYPTSVTITHDGDVPIYGSSKTAYTLNIRQAKVSNLPLEASHGFDRATAQLESEGLVSGAAGRAVGGGMDNIAVVKLDNGAYGDSFTMLSDHSTDSLNFMRHFVFYKDGYQVFITFTASTASYNAIFKELPQFFENTAKMCREGGLASDCVVGGLGMFWNGAGGTSEGADFGESMKGFFAALQQGKGGTVSQGWFDTYNGVMSSVTW